MSEWKRLPPKGKRKSEAWALSCDDDITLKAWCFEGRWNWHASKPQGRPGLVKYLAWRECSGMDLEAVQAQAEAWLDKELT